MLYVTGDMHGEEGRFLYKDSEIDRNLDKGDSLFVCGDFGYIFDGTYRERKFLKFLAENKPYRILWVDGNHENFEMINKYPVEEWNGGMVHIVGRDAMGEPKVIHLMRGQVFEVEGKKIFTFGGGYSIDKTRRTEGVSWFPDEMPKDEEMQEAISNLKKHGNKIDYIISHAAPEDTMNLFYPYHPKEKPLNNFLEWIRESVEYEHWWFGHLHLDEDLYRNQTVLWFQLRNMFTNEIVE